MKLKKIIRFVRKQFENNSIPEKITIFGNTVYLQKNGPQFIDLAKNGIWEKETTEYIQKILRNGDVCLDIGANIGYFTLLFANYVGNTGKVFSFEPEPSNFKILKKNVSINDHNNVIIENLAVTEKLGTVDLYLSENADGQHRIYPSKAVSNNFVTVKAINLDKYFQDSYNLKKISLAKIDVEGSEFGVLKGMKNILEKNNIELILEFSPNQLREFGTDPLDLLDFLEHVGFKFFSFKKNSEIKELENLQNIVNQYEGTAENLLCKK